MALPWLQRCVAGVLLGLVAAAAARAEMPVFRVLGAAEGLPSERVYALAQDRQGYLWIGTGDGLARFDGRDMRVWRHHPGERGSLPTNTVQALHVDAEDRVWIGLEGGGVGWLAADRRDFHRLDTADGDLRGSDIWAIESAADGALWLGGFETGLYRFSADLAEHRHWSAQRAGLRSNTLLELQADAADGIWVGGAEGLQHWQRDRWSDVAGADAAVARAPVLALSMQRDRLLVGFPAGAFELGSDGALVRLHASAAGPAFGVLADAAGSLWIGRNRGIERSHGGRSEHWIGSPRMRYSPGTQAIFDLLQDHEGGLWMASIGNGLLRLPPDWQRFRSWMVAAAGLDTALPRAAAFAGDEAVWVAGADGHIERIDLDSGEVAARIAADTNWPDRQLASIWVAPNGDVWAGHPRGLLRVQSDGKRVEHWPAAEQDDAPRRGMVDLIIGDGADGFWLSIHGVALEHRNGAGQLLLRVDAESGLASADSEQLRVDADGALWVAGGGGLFRLDAGTASLRAVAGIEGERVFGFVFAGDDELWVARRTGLQRFRRDGERWTLLAEVAAFVGLEVGGLSRDGAGDLWASSARGLWRYSPARRREQRYGLGDGLPGQEFATRPMAESASGKFVAVLPDGVVAIEPERFVERQVKPRLHAEPITLRRDGATLELPWSGQVQLRHDDRDIHIGVQAISFADPQDWSYRIRLQGFDPDWAQLPGRGERSYASLPPGDYQLQTAVAGLDGAWTALPTLAVSVSPPWWSSRWGRLGEVALAALLVWLGYRVLRRRTEQRALARLADSQRRWALAASEQKSRFLADLAHEIRTPMTGVMGMAELLAVSPLNAQQQSRVAAIQQSGGLLLRLLNDALDLARIEAGKLDLRSRAVVLRPLLHATLAMLEGNAHGKQLALQLRIDDEVPDRVEVDPERLQQVLLNLLGNAIKFTERGEVALELSCNEFSGELLFAVCDTGPGLTAEQQARLFQRFSQADGVDTEKRYGGSGLGLTISHELVAAMGGRMALHSEPGVGTRVEIHLRLPIARDDETPLANAGDAAKNVASMPLEPPAIAASPRILLVEDDPLAAEALLGLLGLAGYQGVHAGHALAALTELAQAPFAAALLDLDLPGIDGLTLARMLRQSHPALPLVALTARSDGASEQAATQAGCVGFLRKPASAEWLATALQRAIAQGGVG